MTTHEFGQPQFSGELERLQSLGFERVASSNFVSGGGLLIEQQPDSRRLYAPFGMIDSEKVEAVRLSDTFMGKAVDGICMQVMQQPSPEEAERWGDGKYFLAFTSNGSGGGMGDKGDAGRAAAMLVDLSQKSLVEQLKDSGFEQELSEKETCVLRYASPQGELVAVVDGDQLKGIFAPMDTAQGSSHRNVDLQQLEIVGIGEFKGFLGSDPVETGVRVSNGWAEFTIDPNYPTLRKQPRVVREPSSEEVGVALLEEVVEQTGFVQAGSNDSETIRHLGSINDIPVEQLEVNMQPASMSGAGFLGVGESLIDVLVRDNDVVRSLGLTHQELALPLRYIQSLYHLGMLTQTSERIGAPDVNEITIGGHPYAVGIAQWRGQQESPFRDGTAGSYDMDIVNLETGHVVSAPALLSDMIARYGFYEGTGTSYRTAPEEIIRTFTHLNERVAQPGREIDPIAALTSGQTNEAVLSTSAQIARFSNLYDIGLPSIREANVTIRFSSGSELLAFLNNENNEALIPFVATEGLREFEPSPLRLEGYAGVSGFVDVLEQLDEEVQHQIIDLVSAIDLPQQDSWTRKSALKEMLEVSIKEQNGAYKERPAARLAEKAHYTPAEFLQAFYDASGGNYREWATQKIGEARATHDSKVGLDEDRARALGSLFGDQVMPFVEGFREAMKIDANQPADEQIITFMKGYHLLEKAQSMAEHHLVKYNLPGLELPGLVRLSGIIYGLKLDTERDEVSEGDREFLSSHNVLLSDLIDAKNLYPGGSPKTVISQLYNGALDRARNEQ